MHCIILIHRFHHSIRFPNEGLTAQMVYVLAENDGSRDTVNNLGV